MFLHLGQVTAILNYFHYNKLNFLNCVSVDSDGGKEDLNPFSYKRFVSDDLASRNKRVLQVFDHIPFLKLMKFLL